VVAIGKTVWGRADLFETADATEVN